MQCSQDDSDSEEEMLVYADFKDLTDRDIVMPGNLKLVKVVGIDSESPIIQLNNLFFQGKYERCLGTNLFFMEDSNPPELDPIFVDVPEVPLKYLCKTRKVLNMKRIFLTPKDTDSVEHTTENIYPELETHASSIEEAYDKFKKYMEQCEPEKTTAVRSESKSKMIPNVKKETMSDEEYKPKDS